MKRSENTEACSSAVASNAGLGIPCCDHQPIAIHIYGVYEIAGMPRNIPMNEVALCDVCGQDLWARIKDSVAEQYMHYEVTQMPNAELTGSPKASPS